MIEIDANENREVGQSVPAGHNRRAIFGAQLREIRLQHGLTQAKVQQLAGRLSKRQKCPDFAITKSRLSRIENGWSVPGPAKLLSLAKIYHLSIKQMVRLWSGQDSNV